MDIGSNWLPILRFLLKASIAFLSIGFVFAVTAAQLYLFVFLGKKPSAEMVVLINAPVMVMITKVGTIYDFIFGASEKPED